MTQIDIELEQYRTLRAEILRSMEDGNQIMSFGLAALGLILNAGFGAKDILLGFLVFAVVVPGLSGLVLSMWFSAHERISRASYFLTGVESRMKQLVMAKDMPTWECWLRLADDRGRHHFWNTEYSGIGILLFLIFGSLIFSLTAGGNSVSLSAKLCAGAIVLIVVTMFFVALWSRVRRWQHWLSTTSGE